jgi:hypothetical protein
MSGVSLENIQHPTSNIQQPMGADGRMREFRGGWVGMPRRGMRSCTGTDAAAGRQYPPSALGSKRACIGCLMLGVGCWMFSSP